MSEQIDNERAGGEPRYKLTERAYINDQLFEPGQVIVYREAPGWHMEPVNDAARAMKKKHPSQYADPILQMTAVR